MGEIGQVTEKKKNKITVRLERTEACAKCRACTAGMKKEDMHIECLNMCNADIDDNVEITIEEGNFFKAVMIMYGIPCTAFFAGIIAGYYGSIKLGYDNPELISMAIAVVLVIITYAVIRSKESYWRSKNFIPKAIKVVSRAENNS
ncbi:MAG: SoxR reducing system RseC family protein [Firmicutes bacterium]|nr:SoxR reducing system RseC family protein [Bacillota bacterium]